MMSDEEIAAAIVAGKPFLDMTMRKVKRQRPPLPLILKEFAFLLRKVH